MKTTTNNENARRTFLRQGGIITVAGLAGLSAVALGGCKKDEDDVTPPEDLMREHGILNRVLLVYDHFLLLFSANQPINPQWLSASAGIIKSFIEDYHEKQEEDFLFPRFEKANKLVDLVKVLRLQHERGRIITGQILALGAQGQLSSSDKLKLATLLTSFIHMYRPHEAREDTVLFPAIREIVSKHEFDSMGEDFEKREHQMFGERGFESFVNKVADIEKQIGIYDLSQFTPAV